MATRSINKYDLKVGERYKIQYADLSKPLTAHPSRPIGEGELVSIIPSNGYAERQYVFKNYTDGTTYFQGEKTIPMSFVHNFFPVVNPNNGLSGSLSNLFRKISKYGGSNKRRNKKRSTRKKRSIRKRF